MSSIWTRIQRVQGRVLKTVHKVMGFKVSYTVCTDTTVEGLSPVTLANVPIMPASAGQVEVAFGGRHREVFEPAEGQGEGGLGFFVLSREALRSGATYYEPTPHDTFVKTGTTTPVFFIVGIGSIGPEAAGWVLRVKAVYHSHAAG